MRIETEDELVALADELDTKLQLTPRGHGKHIPLIFEYFKKARAIE